MNKAQGECQISSSYRMCELSRFYCTEQSNTSERERNRNLTDLYTQMRIEKRRFQENKFQKTENAMYSSLFSPELRA